MENLETQKIEVEPQKPVRKKSVMITLIVLYSLLLIAGVLLVAIPSLQSVISGIGICKDISARAYAMTIGLMWIALTPSIGYYFATISPCNIGKKGKVVIAVITTLLLIALTVAFFVVVNFVEIDRFVIKYYYKIESSSDVWFIPLSMVFAVLGIMICYALTLFKLNPDKIKDVDTEQKRSGFFHFILHIFKLLIGLIVKLIKAILKFKEKHINAFIILATLLLTWLMFFTAFIFAIICIALLVGAIIMYFAGVLSLAAPLNSGNYLEVYDGGEKLTLEYQPYLVGEDRYEQVYKDNKGRTWYSTDNGSTVYRKEQ